MYGIPTLPVDKRTGQVIPGLPPVVGYVGQSVQTVKQREDQHRPTQPFGDVICGGSWVIEEGLWTQAELDARERHYIKHGVVLIPGQAAQRPVYNYEHNLDNPDRIEVWRAREHRLAREPGWQPGVVPVQRGRGRPVARRGWRWTRRRVQAVALAVVWLTLFAAAWWSGWDVWHGWDGPRNAAISATGAMGAGWGAWRRARPKRRRRRRRR
ncbi:hypothetical protein ACIODS_12060 [Micromonospora chalcea]|uniref:hypothetical protein n=1 Tax=Micromonospora chalcea TaxID=1874 RepID=UPI00381984B6